MSEDSVHKALKRCLHELKKLRWEGTPPDGWQKAIDDAKAALKYGVPHGEEVCVSHIAMMVSGGEKEWDRLPAAQRAKRIVTARDAIAAHGFTPVDGKWISVMERLPETTGLSQQYLALMENGDCCACWWMNIGGWDWDPPSPITHWMQLPRRPQR